MKSNQAMVIQMVGDKGRLDELESTISRNMKAFYEIGSALKEIRDSRLYKTVLGFDTFEAYCKEQWDFGVRYAQLQMASSQVVANLENTNNCSLLPVTESQARPLSKLPPPLQVEAWTKSVETAPDGKVSARHVSKVVRGVLDDGQKEKFKKITADEKQIDDFKAAAETLEKAVRAAKRNKYKTTSTESILGDIEALRNIVDPSKKQTKRQITLQEKFWSIDHEIIERTAFHVKNSNIGQKMQAGDKIFTAPRIIEIEKSRSYLLVRVVVERKVKGARDASKDR